MNKPVTRALFFTGKHFGTGVILATAFAHLLQDAFSNLAKAGPRWRNVAGLTTLGSLLTIFLVEYGCTAYVEYMMSRPRPMSGLADVSPRLPAYRDDPSADGPGPTPFPVPVPPPGQDDYFAAQPSRPSNRRRRNAHRASELKTTTREEAPLDRTTHIIGLLVLQFGIMIHSLVIGITLAFTSGADFTSLVTAIIFHQLFEGISLGVRISELPAHQGTSHILPGRPSILPRVLVVLFALTVPFGILLGLYALPREIPQLAGLLQAASAGMLIYAGTVEMLAEDFVHSGEDRVSGKQGAWAIGALLAGAVLMGILGWA
ncbi:Zinc/iron permease [Exidia glandulosa HHB12029]|uniref:Zinc/iron permease n=1 Tax=Exidia glandulosa HHB12029 TaxID=1314781 RepID=A0A165DJQ9_EXIGL|nr:Zinc/iron permease [Exidia glandulosa HHB12029]